MTDNPSLKDIKPSLGQVVQMFSMQALMACGKMMNPMTRKFETNLELAAYQIGVLEMLDEKTRPTQTDEEKQIFEEMLHQARMAYMDATRPGGPAKVEVIDPTE